MLQRLTCARASRDVAASASAPRTLLTQSVGTRRVSAWRCAAGTESAAVGRIACRSFSSSPVARADKDVVKDPEHPDGIYYHKLAEGRFAMSFFEQKPSSPAAASVMAIVTRPQRGDDRNVPIYEIAAHKPDQVETNKAFMALLHETMKAEGVPQDGLIEYEAALRKDGWAHVSDQRHQLMPGRIPTPENIIASVAFVDYQVAPDSYEANETYRLVTAEEGIMQLRPNWLDLIKNACKAHQ